MPIFDVQHQGPAHRLIQRALAGERVPHAYLFHGPEGVGKEMLAIRLAKVLLCEKPEPWPAGQLDELGEWDGPTFTACGRCRSCHLVDVGSHPDLHLIHRHLNAHHPELAVRNRKALELGVEVVRQFVIDVVGVAPSCGRARVFVIRDADRISAGAQNALLKTLEEPPPATFLILLCSSLDRLLSTTRSRCQRVPFAPLPITFVADRVRELGDDLPEEDATLVSALAQGSLGTALMYAKHDLAGINREVVKLLGDLSPDGARAAAGHLIALAKGCADAHKAADSELTETDAQRRGLLEVLLLVATYYRDLLHVRLETENLIANVPALGRLRPAAARVSRQGCTVAIAAVGRAEQQLQLNANTQLCIESMMFRIAGAAQPTRQRVPA